MPDPSLTATPWLTPAQAADRVHVKPITIARAVQRRQIRHVRVGGQRLIRFKAEWVDAWLADRASEVPPQATSKWKQWSERRAERAKSAQPAIREETPVLTPDAHWYTVKAAAAVLGISTYKVYRAIYAGRLQQRMWMGQSRIHHDALGAFRSFVLAKREPVARINQEMPTLDKGARRRRADAGTWVYFIQTADARFVKIGISKNVYSRLLELQGAHPEQLRLLGQVLVSPDVCEGYWQRKYAADRAVGEWFRLTPGLQDEIDVVLAAAKQKAAV